jgi:hypothetical protein
VKGLDNTATVWFQQHSDGCAMSQNNLPFVQGGTEVVTKFGTYDRTQDFIGGGTNPAMIHDPGEFEALRADA